MNTEERQAKPVRHYIWWLPLLLLFWLFVFAGLNFQRGVTSWMPEARVFSSSYNRKATGTSGFYELSAAIGLAPKRWQLSYRRLGLTRGVLLIISPAVIPKDFEDDEILSWVAAGNNLVYLDHFAFSFERRILDKLHIGVLYSGSIKTRSLTGNSEMPVFQHVNKVEVSFMNRLKADGQSKVLLGDSQGAVLIERHYGKGRILLGTAPGLCTNFCLADKTSWGNFQFLANWLSPMAPGGVLLFDEKCHGYMSSRNVFLYLIDGPLGLVCFQLCLIFFILLGSSRRFGRPDLPPPKYTACAGEYVEGIKNTYRKARAHGLVVKILGGELRAQIVKTLSCFKDDADDVLLAAWKVTGRPEAEALARILAEIKSCQSGKQVLSETELVSFVQRLDRVADALKFGSRQAAKSRVILSEEKYASK